MKDSKEEQEFLAKNFKAGEYSQVTVLVKNGDLDKMIAALTNANLTLAIMPSARAGIEFDNIEKSGTPQ